MTSMLNVRLEDNPAQTTTKLISLLQDIREISISLIDSASTGALLPDAHLLSQISTLSELLVSTHPREAATLSDVHTLSTLSPDFGGLGLIPDFNLSSENEKSILFLVSAYLESLNSQDRVKSTPLPLGDRPEGRRGMTLSEKILAAHDVEQRGELKPGDMMRVDVDFIIASELSWGGMETEYDALGKPGIWRNDRFWLAGDHVVDPRIKDNVKVKELVKSSERARDDFKMTEYQGMNYTIMHTEFFRSAAQPGMLVVGSDSHTCSAGSLGCLSIGLGVSDVTIPLITGQTWFKVPESVSIRLINSPPPGIGGKDTILYILQQLKRNTVASDRVVEFSGSGLQHLSCDARFAIANMTTEFGGVTGIFVPDQITYDFVEKRKLSKNKKLATYFRPDEDAIYAETHVIDLSKVESFVALYPSPDDVVPVSDSKIAERSLDGCFIGACTTAEEDLVIGAMVLELAMKSGVEPIKDGKRRVVPGSLPILHRLRELGFVDVYEKAGFTVGVPGCSYCVGMGADRAGEGEVWLSSQNRNFENRMGRGAIGSIASAATVAASSLRMKVTDPKPYLEAIDRNKLDEILGRKSTDSTKGPRYVEPSGRVANSPAAGVQNKESKQVDIREALPKVSNEHTASLNSRRGKAQVLGDFIDTDALAPSEYLTICKTAAEIGQHCLEHTHPDFRSLVGQGHNIVVAGHAFGCGSSRENAVSALQGCGVQAVIAKSFSFIYGRNAPNLGLVGIVIKEESFYTKVRDGMEIEIDLDVNLVRIVGDDDGWAFEMSGMEKELIEIGGLTSAFRKFGKGLFDVLTIPKGKRASGAVKSEENCGTVSDLQW